MLHAARRLCCALSLSSVRLCQNVIKSPFPEVHLPPQQISAYVLDKAAKFGAATAYQDAVTGHSSSFEEVVQKARMTASNLRHGMGFAPRDVIAINAPNTIEYPVLFHGLLSCGGVATTIPPVFGVAETVNQLKDSRAKGFITTLPQLPSVMEATSQVGIPPERVIVMTDYLDPKDLRSKLGGATPSSDLYHGELKDFSFTCDLKSDPATLTYSSGTTGLPKGVILSHENLMANLQQLSCVEPPPSEDVFVAVLPFFHCYGLMMFMFHALAGGGKSVVMSKFELPLFLQTIQNHKVTRAMIAPPIAVALAKHPLVDSYDLSSLRMLFSGAAPLSSEVEAQIQQRLKVPIKQAYGMTELSPASNVSPDGDMRPSSVGPLLPNTSAKIVCPLSGKTLGPDQPGEVWIRGPQVMVGYHERPDANKDVFTPCGFLKTGDIGKFDADGFLYITDRLKELIKYKGHQVAPATLEAVLLTHPKVADCAVVPQADEACGEIPKAFVVLRANQQTTAAELMDWVAARVNPFERVRIVEFTTEIPKSASGKILRRLLRDKK